MNHYFESGFSVRQPMWHGLGNVPSDYPGSWDEARHLAGLDFEPIKVPTYEYRGIDCAGNVAHAPADGVIGDYFEDEDRQRVVRSDTGATLAIANGTYELISHAEMGSVVEAILDQPNVKYETAGVLEGGRAVWALALLDEPVQLSGRCAEDVSLTLPYVALLNRHDGGAAFRVASTSVRIVCANTWRASEIEAEQTGTGYSFRHTRNWRDKIDEAREVITGVRRDFRAYCETATELLGIHISPAQSDLFISEFIPMPPDGLISQRTRANVETARTSMRRILRSATTQPVAHTAFGLVQAAGEYLDHVRRFRTAETKMNRSLLTAEPMKAKAVRLAREVANA